MIYSSIAAVPVPIVLVGNDSLGGVDPLFQNIPDLPAKHSELGP